MKNKIAKIEKVEKEVKFKIESISEIKQRLKEIKAKFVSKVFENTIRFDDAHKSLHKMEASFRLRKGITTELTFKEKLDTSDGVRSSKKFTVEISDFDTMKTILEQLGYKVCQRFHKEREYWKYGDTIICIDTIPIGLFLEIEGRKRDIVKVAKLLNLDFNQKILKHYGELWEEHCKKHNIRQKDIVFEEVPSLKKV